MVEHDGQTIPTIKKRVSVGDQETFSFDFSSHFGCSATLTSFTFAADPPLTELHKYQDPQAPIAYFHCEGFQPRTKHLIICTATSDNVPNARRAVRRAYIEVGPI